MQINTEEALKTHYEQIWSNGELAEELEYYKWALSLFSPKPGDTLLDIACGAGYFLREAEKSGLKCTGLDISENALAKARQLCKETRFYQGNAEKLPFSDSSFHLVSCLGSVEHFLNPVKALLEMKRVLKPEGMLSICVPNLYFERIRNLLAGVAHSQERETFYTLEQAVKLIEKDGKLRVIKVFPFNPSGKKHIQQKNFKMLNKLIVSAYKLVSKYIPLKLSYSFVFLCRK